MQGDNHVNGTRYPVALQVSERQCGVTHGSSGAAFTTREESSLVWGTHGVTRCHTVSHGITRCHTRTGCLHHERGVVTRLGALTFGARRAPSSPVVARSLQRAASRTFAADRPFAKLLFGATLESATTTPTVTSEWLRRPILMHHVISRRDARVGDHGADGYFPSG